LLANLQPNQLAEQLFEVVINLNAGCHLIEDAAEQVKLVELNLTAARKAYAATAYRSALQFYRAASRFLETPGFAGQLWRDRHELIMSLFKEWAGCEFLEGILAEAENCIQQAVAHAGTAIEQADALSILIVQYTLLARYPEAIAAGRRALATLGISLPEAGYEEARNDEIAQVRQELGSRPVSALSELPVMSQPEMLMVSRILITMGPPCYRSDQRLWGVLVPRVVNLTLRYGNIPQIGYSHTAFGGLLAWVDDDYATAKEFGELATRLMTGTFRSPSDQSVFYLMIGSSIRHWFKHLRHGTQDYRDAYEIGLRSGNLQYAAYAFGHDMYCRFYQGVPLAGLIQETQRSLAFGRTRHNQWAIDLLEGGLEIFGGLSGESPASKGNDRWSEAEFLRRVADYHNIQVTCIYKVLKTFSLLVSGDHENALALSDETEPLIYTVGTQGLLPWPEHVFARLLIFTALYAKAEERRQTRWRAELDRMLGRLRIWADNCPENFEHKYFLAAAELARIDGRRFEAMELYDRAVEAAQAGNFLQWVGLANERAYNFWLECGNERLAQVYWQQAYVCFDRWGAAAKVGSMETAYREVVAGIFPAGDSSGQPAGKLERQSRDALAERQIGHLRNHAFQVQQAKLQVEATTQAEELAHAMQRVRVEIAERKRAEQALRDSAGKLRLFADNVPTMTVSYDENLHCRFANKSFAEFFGFTVEDILGKHVQEVIGEEAYREVEGYFAQVLQGHPVTFQRTRKLQHGESRYLEVKLLPHLGERGQTLGCFAVMVDITEHKLVEERIQHVAHHDSLTGLANRLLFNDRLSHAISLAKRDLRQFALLYLDLDRFKAVNDTLGHAAGDELLQSVAARIRRQVRESDTVARVGGDEFTVILSDIGTREQTEAVARKIIAELAAPFQLGSEQQSVDIGTSIGIALYPADARDADALVKVADAAMYGAKQAGSGFRFWAG
jgi:diguanylate cyclase (GGDEF)-like protein/PAS domain S-box-containing protein